MNHVLAPDSPTIMSRCDGCRVAIPDFVENSGYAYYFGVGVAMRDTDREGWVLCESCGTEAIEFADTEVSYLEDPPRQQSEWPNECGFCRGSMDETPYEFRGGPSQGPPESEVAAAICRDCSEILKQFVDMIPEDDETRFEEVCYPSALTDVDVPTAATDPADSKVREFMQTAASGDDFSFTTFIEGRRDLAGKFYTGEAVVVENSKSGLGNVLTAEPVDGIEGFPVIEAPDLYKFEYGGGSSSGSYAKGRAHWEREDKRTQSIAWVVDITRLA
jgi:hypothetical protein